VDADLGSVPQSAVTQNAAVRERRERIRAHVAQEGFARIEDLAEAYSVSLMTIHRDLDALQSQGWLRKLRGGVTARPSASFHGDVRQRMQLMWEAKQELAATAVKLVQPGQSVILDESTTGLALAELLPRRAPITVITNFLAVIKLLAGEPGVDLIALGGGYHPAYDAFLGIHTREAVQSLHADLLIMSTTAVTKGRCLHQSQETVAVERAMMDAAAHRILLLDHSKFRRRGVHELAPVTAFDIVIVDSGTSAADIDTLRSLGANVHVAGHEPDAPDMLDDRMQTAAVTAADAP
jgi:DeoR/GlpR family transcriptional regulator of sugar metabolism